jgi:UDP:flavonoid glycosyltransferase YjiC (YdhE family)
LTHAIRRVLADDALRFRLGHAGEQMARTKGSAAAAADRLREQLGWN